MKKDKIGGRDGRIEPSPPSQSIENDTYLSAETIEKMYHRMVDEVSDYAIILLSTDGRILTWNPGAEQIKGYTEDEIRGKNFTVFYPEDDRKRGLPHQLLSEARENGRAAHEGWRVKKDGTKFWGSVVITAMHDDFGATIGFSKLTRDLTQRKANEEQLRRTAIELEQKNEQLRLSEERYHRMVSEVEDYAIILLDTEGNIQNWNKGAEKIKGYKEYEAVGRNFNIFYLPDDRADNLPQKLLNKALTENKAAHEGWRIRKDGTRFWGSTVITALHDDQGNVVGFSKVTRDLTQKKNSEDFILLQNRQLEEFAYIASHDLQEPLRKIIIFGDLIGRNLDRPEIIKEYLSKITYSTDRMAKLIKAVLAYSQSSTAPQKFEPIDLNDVVAEVQGDFELLLSDCGGRVFVDKLPMVKGIPIQMHQLFTNLVSNAIKFSKEQPEIRISSTLLRQNNDSFARIAISDNGIGFKPEYAEKIFKMFHRLNTDNPGTGIGLALCKRIVENHGGMIQASSVPGEGSTFEIVLPTS